MTIYDIMAAEDIVGTNLEYLKGNTMRRESPSVMVTCIAIPPYIKERYMNATL